MFSPVPRRPGCLSGLGVPERGERGRRPRPRAQARRLRRALIVSSAVPSDAPASQEITREPGEPLVKMSTPGSPPGLNLIGPARPARTTLSTSLPTGAKKPVKVKLTS